MLDKSMPARKQGTRGAVGERGERVRRGVEKREREREREREAASAGKKPGKEANGSEKSRRWEGGRAESRYLSLELSGSHHIIVNA